MREQEVEVEEKTVERIYCDECGDECTDSVRFEPKEVCQSCSSDSAVKKLSRIATMNDSDDPIGWWEAVFLTVVFPATSGILLMGYIDHTVDEFSTHNTRIGFTYIVGTFIWTLLFSYMIFAL